MSSQSNQPPANVSEEEIAVLPRVSAAINTREQVVMGRFAEIAVLLFQKDEREGHPLTQPIRQDLSLQDRLSHLLRVGMLGSTGIVLFGGVLYLIRHGHELAGYHIFQGEPSFYCSPLGAIEASLAGRSRGIIQVGLLCLMATPIVRVILSLGIFLWRRDYPYAVISGLVFLGFIYSLVGAYL